MPLNKKSGFRPEKYNSVERFPDEPERRPVVRVRIKPS
jgi:hypothetical protein